jgi:hypothetical protein
MLLKLSVLTLAETVPFMYHVTIVHHNEDDGGVEKLKQHGLKHGLFVKYINWEP